MELKTKNGIILVGFYGRGNIGDDAMMLNTIRHLRDRLPETKIFIPAPSYVKLDYDFPYNNVGFIGWHERGRIHDAGLVIIGGGDLGPGFGVDFLITSRINNCKSALMGVSINDCWKLENLTPFSTHLTDLFDKMYVRDSASLETLKSVGCTKAIHSTDIAVDLKTDDRFKVEQFQDYTVMVIREVQEKDLNKQTHWVKRFLENLPMNHNVVVLPFCSEDYVYSKSLINSMGLNLKVPVLFNTNPIYHNTIIKKAQSVVSIGRLHPLVFALANSVPVLAVTYPQMYGYHKIQAWVKDFGQEKFIVDFEEPLERFNELWPIFVKECPAIRKQLEEKSKSLKDINAKMFDDICSLMKG